MPKITSFAFLSQVCDRFDEMNNHTKQFSVAPLSSMTPTFICPNKVGLQYSMAAFCIHLPNQTKLKKRRENIADVIEWYPRRNGDLSQSFQTYGTQVILNCLR